MQLHVVSSSIQVCDYSLCLYNLYKLSLKFLKMGIALHILNMNTRIPKANCTKIEYTECFSEA